MGLLVSVLRDPRSPEHEDNDGVDESVDWCKWNGKVDLNGEPDR